MFKEFILLIGQLSNLFRQFSVELPERSEATDLKDIPFIVGPDGLLFKQPELASSRVGFHLLQKRHARTAGGKITLDLHFPGLGFEFGKPASVTTQRSAAVRCSVSIP